MGERGPYSEQKLQGRAYKLAPAAFYPGEDVSLWSCGR